MVAICTSTGVVPCDLVRASARGVVGGAAWTEEGGEALSLGAGEALLQLLQASESVALTAARPMATSRERGEVQWDRIGRVYARRRAAVANRVRMASMRPWS